MQDRDELNLELRRRINELMLQSMSDSEYLASVRPVLYESVAWVVIVLLLWTVAVAWI